MRTIDDLALLVAAPTEPVGAGGDWASVEATLGLGLPGDFKALVHRYGRGQFADITLLTPFGTHPGGVPDLVTRALGLLDLYRELREEWPEDFPYPLCPEPAGLLEWATTGNGDSLCWLTDGQPESWPVVVWNVRDGAERYDKGAVALLYDYLSGELDVPLLGPAPPVPWFDPYRHRSHVSLQLSEGDLPYAERLRILRNVLQPTANRGGYDGRRGTRQDHFKATDRDWLLTYENCYGHQIRAAFPPEDDNEARRTLLAAAQAMHCRIVAARTIEGHPIWSEDIATT